MINLSSRKIIGIIMILAAIMVFAGCSSSTGDHFDKITVKEKLAKFSFEYSDFYREIEGPSVSDKGAISVRLMAPEKHAQMINPDPYNQKTSTVTVTYRPAYIDIFVYNAQFRNGTAAGDLDNGLNKIRISHDSKILEQSQITVAGIPATQVVYVSNSLLPMASGPEEEIPAEYFRWVIFDHNGLIWEIDAESETSLAEQVKEDFEHILQTFQILE
jgi:hypothetical protein